MTVEKWLKEAKEMFITKWGIDKHFAEKVATFYAYLFFYQLNPVITSGYRSQETQLSLIKRFEAGDDSVVVRPATNSDHTRVAWGLPASHAIDIKTSTPALAASIAKQVGVGAGYYYKNSDPVHFYYVG